MAQYTDLPEEINREILLKQSSSNIIHHCNVDKNTRKICDNVYFWNDYMKGMKEYEIIEFVLASIRRSQDFIMSIYKAAGGLILLNSRIDDTVLFYSIMRNDSNMIEYLKTFYNKINYAEVVITTNQLIDVINGGHASARELGKLYVKLGLALTGSQIQTLPIFDQLKIGSISRLPALLMNEEEDNVYINEEEDNVYINQYELFILDIISNLASNGNTKDLIDIVQKSYDNNAPLDAIYYSIAGYLPTELFSYLQSKLPEKVKLGKYIDIIRDRDHAYYLLLHPSLIKNYHYAYLPNFINADDLVNEIYTSKSHIDKNQLIDKIIKRNIARSYSVNVNPQWVQEVEKKWKKINN